MALKILNPHDRHTFIKPLKRINEGQDVSEFLVSQAYGDVITFLVQLNRAMFPRKDAAEDDLTTHPLESVMRLQALLSDLNDIIDQTPLAPGTHRFGNLAFRNWFQTFEEHSLQLLDKHLPQAVLEFPHGSETSPILELQAYLLGAFGSAQRLDYGTGHELSFLAFLGGIWKLGGFQGSDDGRIEKQIVLQVLQPYLVLVRKLILKYSLEPAGSHGVWGLDDHSFLPYIFGSAQYGPSMCKTDATPIEGSSPGAPNPGDVVRSATVQKERNNNLYFGAIGFIYDVKKGPFWEHSPTLFDISGVKDGWGKINKGMLKMYNAEVLSKFPVVQHFPFGSLFSFERDPEAQIPTSTAHSLSLAQRETPSHPAAIYAPMTVAPMTAAPWSAASNTRSAGQGTFSPRISEASSRSLQGRGQVPANQSNEATELTKAPWSK